MHPIHAPTVAVRQVFVTKPDAGMTQYLDLPIAVLVYRETTFRDMYPEADYPDVQSPPPLTDDDVAAIKKEIEEVRLFYWRHSKLKLNAAFDLIEITKPLGLKDIAAEPQPTYWLGPNDRVVADLETALAAKNKTPFDYAGVITLFPWRNYEQGDVRIRAWAAAGTFGLPCPWSKDDYCETLGYSGIFVKEKQVSELAWPFAFEFHHQVEGLMKASAEWYYPSAERPDMVAGEFGWRYAFIAHMLRSVDASKWLQTGWGEIVTAADADHDGVPDKETAVPLDEERLLSKTDSADSDGDGLSDLDEATLGLFKHCDPNNADTDGDGVVDGKDQTPTIKLDTSVRKKTPAIDGEIGADEWDLAAEFEDSQGRPVKIDLNWDDDNLYVAATVPRTDYHTLALHFDLDGDGWFRGDDNVRLFGVGMPLYACSRTDYVKGHRFGELVPITSKQQMKKNEDTYVVEIAITSSDDYDLKLRAGKKIGLELRFGEGPGARDAAILWPSFVQIELK